MPGLRLSTDPRQPLEEVGFGLDRARGRNRSLARLRRGTDGRAFPAIGDAGNGAVVHEMGEPDAAP
jgi:hypothetical protein